MFLPGLAPSSLRESGDAAWVKRRSKAVWISWKAAGVGLHDRTVVPLDAGEERRLAEVGAADEGDAGAVRALEDVGTAARAS